MFAEKDAPSSLKRVVMGQAKKVTFIGNCFPCCLNTKIRFFFFKSDGEAVGSTVTADKEGPDLELVLQNQSQNT